MNITNQQHTEWNDPYIAQRADPYILHHTDGMGE